MINLNAFITSLKSTWIRRLLQNDGTWSNIILENLNLNKITIYGNKYTKTIINQVKNKFWKDVLESYSKLIEMNIPQSEEEFLSCPIFFNNNITIDNKAIFNKNWANKSILFINDLIDNSGNIYNLQELEQKYDIKSNFLTHHSITTAVKNYKNKLFDKNIQKSITCPLISINVQPLIHTKKGCKTIYNILNKNSEVPTSQSKWKEIYDIEDETWEEIYNSPFKSTNHTSLQWFQYRINHRLLPTKKYLHMIKKSDTPNCNSCQQTETISHMLWTCPSTKTFIQQCKTLFLEKHINLPYNEESFIFNISKTATTVDLQIMIEIKQYIFSSKYLKTQLSLKALINKLKFSFKSHKQIAIKNNKLENFENIWRKYETLLDPK